MASLRKLELKRLLSHLQGDGPPLVITGSRGSGKTTLCKGLWELVQEEESRICVGIWVGDGGRSGFDENLVEDMEKTAAGLLRRVGVKHRVQRTKNEKEGPALPYFEVEGRRVFLLVDGLDHLQSQKGVDASFLPMDVPPGTRLVVSVSHGPIVEALAARGWHVHEVAPLNFGERCRQVEVALAIHEQKSELRDPLVRWPPATHPSNLAMAITLARLTGVAPASGDDVPAVVGRLLDRLDLQPTDAALFAVCKHGIPKSHELDLALTRRMRRLEPAVVERNGVFGPATSEVRHTLRARCTEEQLRAAHLQAFEAISKQQLYLFYKEAVEHLLTIGAHERLAGFITEINPFQHLNHADIGLLVRCWQTMGLRDGPERYQRMLEAALPSADASLRVSLLNNVGLMASDLDWSEAALHYRRRALEEARKAFPATHSKVGTPLLNLAHQLQKGPDPDGEEERLYQEMLSVIDGPLPVHENYPTKWLTLRFYAAFLENRNRYEEGQARREEGVAAARRALGANHPSTAMELLWTGRAICWRKPRQALAYAEQAYEILQAALGPSSDRSVFALRIIAAAQRELGQIDKSLATSQRALEMGRKIAKTHPEEAGHALEILAHLAEARNDRRTAIETRQEHYQHLRKHLGPAHATTLSSGWSLALRLEAAGQNEAALKLVENLRERYCDLRGPEHADTLDAAVVAARLCWRLGQRTEAERRLDEVGRAVEAGTAIHIRAMLRLLRSEWAREDGQGEAQREYLQQALQIYQDSNLVTPRRGLFHVMIGGQLFLAGDREASARHHEAGAVLIEDWQLHLKSMVTRPYQGSMRMDGDDEAARRCDELEIMFAINGHRPGLDLAMLSGRAMRVAWNPGDGRTLAALDQTGQTHLFAWHAQSLQLERLAPPFPQRALPKDLAAITLRWSESGQALRLHTPDGDESVGTWAADEAWAPASPVSPDGRTAIFFGRNVIFVMNSR